MRIRILRELGLYTTLLALPVVVAHAQTTAQPMQIERVPLIQIDIAQEKAPSATMPGNKNAGKGGKTASKATDKPAVAAKTPATPAKGKTAAKGKPKAVTTKLREESNSTESSVVRAPDIQSGNNTVTTVTTNNNITYNITNHVMQTSADPQQNAPAVTMSIKPDNGQEVAPLNAPPNAVVPPPAQPAPAGTPEPLLDAPTEGEVLFEEDQVEEYYFQSVPDDAVMPNRADPVPPMVPLDDPSAMPYDAPAALPDDAPAAPQNNAPASRQDAPPAGTQPMGPATTPGQAPDATPDNAPEGSQPQTRGQPRTGMSAGNSRILPNDRIPIVRSASPAQAIHADVKKNRISTASPAGNKPAKADTQKLPARNAAGPSAMSQPYGLWIKATKGEGKRPAVIALSGCGGLYSTIEGLQSRLSPRHETMARVFTNAGFHVMFPDMFTPKGKHGNCTESLDTWAKTAVQDRSLVQGAMNWMAGQDDVDMSRVVFFGWSYGATVMLASLNLAYPDVAMRPFQPKAATGFYPYCQPYLDNAGAYKPAAPIYIVMGENDNWTLPKHCQRLEKDVNQTDVSFKMKTYVDTYHDFDAPGTPLYVRTDIQAGDGKPGGVTAGGNPESRADAYREILQFIHDKLQQPANVKP